jgi:glutamine phosphoribosylpyrophosphate amidotransferase
VDASKFCLACFDGEYPVEIPESVRRGKMALESCG